LEGIKEVFMERVLPLVREEGSEEEEAGSAGE